MAEIKLFGDLGKKLPADRVLGGWGAQDNIYVSLDTVKTESPTLGRVHMTRQESIGPDPYAIRLELEAGKGGFSSKQKRADGNFETLRDKFLRLGGLEADWPLGKMNRIRFMYKPTKGVFTSQNVPSGWPDRPDVPGSGVNLTNADTTIQCGTYCRTPETYNNTQEHAIDYDPSGGNGHCYHGFMQPEELGNWIQLVMDPKAHNLRGQGHPRMYLSRPYGLGTFVGQPYPNHGYMDVQGDIYNRWRYTINPADGERFAEVFWSNITAYEDVVSGDEEELVARISSLGACYIESKDKIWGCFQTRSGSGFGGDGSTDTYTIQIRYSFSTTYGQSFDSLTPMPTQGERVSTGSAYTGHTWEETGIDWGANTVMYVAFRVKENPEFGHREIAICKDNSQLPPLPGV